MAFINTVPEQEAEGDVRDLYEQQRGGSGYLPNYARVYCHRPQLMQAWAQLQTEIKQTMDDKAYGLISLAAAMAINSTYCSLAFATKLISKYYTQEEMLAIVRGDEESPLSAGERAMMKLARQVAANASGVTVGDILPLKEAGYTDPEIFDIVSAAAARCFFSKVPDALGALPDSALGNLEQPLQELLTVGRPVAAGNGDEEGQSRHEERRR
jgi:uncharacterized peroxidase-related enzyme